MWTCPECNRSYLNTSQSHACTDLTVAAHLEHHSPLAREIYRSFEAAVLRNGDVRIHAQKTRIGFINVMTFAGVRLARRWVDTGLILPRATDHPRVKEVDIYGPTAFGHTIRLRSPEEVDEDLDVLIASAADRGLRNVPARGRIEAISGRLLEITRATFTARATTDGFTAPRHVGDSFALHPALAVRVAGNRWRPGILATSTDGHEVVVDGVPPRSIGLEPGSRIDVTVRAGL